MLSPCPSWELGVQKVLVLHHSYDSAENFQNKNRVVITLCATMQALVASHTTAHAFVVLHLLLGGHMHGQQSCLHGNCTCFKCKP